jgi:cytochrome c peroxidase
MPLRSSLRIGLPTLFVLLTLAANHAAGQGPPPPPPPPLPPVPVPPQNPITEPKRLLGKILFWDEQLSSDNSIACGTCHINAQAGSDPRFGRHPGLDTVFNTPDDVIGSPGVVRADDDGNAIVDPLFGLSTQVTPRSAQIVVGSQWSPLLFWDGRASSTFINPENGNVSIPNGGALESQAVGPILSDVEMAHENRDWPQVIAKLTTARPLALAVNLPPDLAAGLSGKPSYPDLFAAAFGDAAITAERIAFAIATYERTLVPNQTPWDRFIANVPGAMTPNQVAGWNFFRGSQCSACHVPPMFTGNGFRNIGLRPIAEDIGRQAVTGNAADRGRFKVPSLRNTGLKAGYMHNGQLESIDEVLDFYQGINGQVQFPNNQDPLIAQINIPPQVRPQLVDFLVNGLTDPRVANEEFPFDRPTLHSEVTFEVALLAECLAGPAATPAPDAPMTAADCRVLFDFDNDNDVDLKDVGAYQQAQVGAGS